MNQWLGLAFRPSVVRRAVLYACVVGAVLITINHGDTIITGKATGAHVLKMLLTLVVPYVVSTLSSVGAIRQMEQAARPADRQQRPLRQENAGQGRSEI
jgi:hypothetical protein